MEQCKPFGIFEHHFQASVGDYIPNIWVMFNQDIYQPLPITKPITHMLHVWYIYLHDWVISNANIGKYSSTMEHMGFEKHVYQCCLCEHWLETHPISLAEIERFLFASRAFARQPWMHWQNPMFVAFARMNK